MYYTNLSLTSTYLLAVIVIGVCWFATSLCSYLKPSVKPQCQALKSFLYNFFVMGAALAGVLSVEGALLNPIESITLGSANYILGILLYVGLFVDILYSIATHRASLSLSMIAKSQRRELETGLPDNFHKLRIFCKATILGLLHLSPLYFFIGLFCFEVSAISADFFIHRGEKRWPKLEACQHVVVNIALGMVLAVPDALMGLLLVSVLVLTVIGLDVFLNYQEYQHSVKSTASS